MRVMKDYLQYLHEVLGLRHLPLVERNADESGHAEFFDLQGPIALGEPRDFELLFVNQVTQPKESLFGDEAWDLFSKMQAAMKLNGLSVAAWDCSIEDLNQLAARLEHLARARVVVVFSSFPKNRGELVPVGRSKHLHTHSPAYLVEDPQAKRLVWHDLQNVMRELGVL